VSGREGALARLRAWWFWRQGLSARGAPRTIADCLRRSGWLPTAGSTGVYLSIRARLPATSREAIDRAAIDGTEVVEVPGAHARPPVLVPRDECALALRLHRASFVRHAAPLFASGRYSEAALRAIERQVCEALDQGPLSTSQIRASVTHPDAGELLIGALIDLAVRGIIRRFSAEARLDASSYLYELRHPDDRPDLDGDGDAAEVARKATRAALHRYGPASAAEIADWSALTKTDVRRALTELHAERVEIDGWPGPAWLLPDDVRAWKAFQADEARVVLLPYRDPFVAVRRPPAVLTSRPDAVVLNPAQKPIAIRDASGVNQHTIVAGGELIGVWEYDPDARRVLTRVWSTNRTLRARVADAAADTQRFIREQLGDARRSAVDPPDRRAARAAFVRQSR